MLVGSISTAWGGKICPDRSKRNKTNTWTYDQENIQYQRGDEIGCFHFGSTVILLMNQKVNWTLDLRVDGPIKLGQALGRL